MKGGGSTIPAARLVVFATFLDLFVQFPVVAPFARTLGAAPALVGLIVGVYSLTNLLGNLAAGVDTTAPAVHPSHASVQLEPSFEVSIANRRPNSG